MGRGKEKDLKRQRRGNRRESLLVKIFVKVNCVFFYEMIVLINKKSLRQT
jgi:hypothetical protein